MPSTPFMNVAGGAQPPQQQRPVLSPISLPAFPQMNQNYMDPAKLKGLQDQAAQQELLAKQASDRYHNIDKELLGEPKSAPQSPFEQMMSKGLQDRMVKLFAGTSEGTASSRFGKGFDLGQQIGAHVLTPLMGVMSHTPGGAIGAAQATQNLQQQVAQEKAQKASQEAAHNSMIASLAQMYETMSPSSTKNLIALASKKMETYKYNAGVKDQAFKDMELTSKDAFSARKDILGLDSTAAEKSDASKLGVFNAKVGAANVEQQGAGRVLAAVDKGTELGNQAKQIDLHKESIGNQKTAAGNADTRATSDRTLKAQEQVALRMKQLREDMGKRNALGQPAYPNALADFSNNKAELESLGEMMKTAGMKITPEELIKGMQAGKDALPAKGGGFDWGALMNSIGSGAKNILAGPQQAMPDHRAFSMSDIDAAIAKKAKQNGN